jgi:hypothetical protein
MKIICILLNLYSVLSQEYDFKLSAKDQFVMNSQFINSSSAPIPTIVNILAYRPASLLISYLGLPLDIKKLPKLNSISGVA